MPTSQLASWVHFCVFGFHQSYGVDVIQIDRTNENFRILYDTKGRFAIHRITPEEAKVCGYFSITSNKKQYKLCRIKKVQIGAKGIPFVVTHDGRTIRYPDPSIKVNDTVQVDLETGKILDYAKFHAGQMAMVTGGRNIGRVGTITKREKHPGSYEIVHMHDTHGAAWSTRATNVFVIGTGHKEWISLPRNKGIKLTVIEEFTQKHKVTSL